MLTVGLLIMIALVWAGYGVILIAVPSSCTDWVQRAFARPVHRFLLTQAAILFGLVLLLGTTGHRGYWLWAILGGMAIFKGMFFLGAPGRLRDRVFSWWYHLPRWGQRLSGVLTMGLAALLIIDTALASPGLQISAEPGLNIGTVFG